MKGLGMKLPAAYHRATLRYQRLTPVVGVTATLWGIHLGFQRVNAAPASLNLLIRPSEIVEAFGVSVFAAFAVFAALVLIERKR